MSLFRGQRIIYCALLFFFLFSRSAEAAIQKFFQVENCKNAICLYWWPKLPNLEGWYQDIDSSYHYNANALAPDGFTFLNADTVMIAVAVYKPRDPEDKTLDSFIEGDIEKFKKTGAKISETSSLITANGKKLKSYRFVYNGGWERVSYGEEGDYWLTFTINSRSEAGFKKNMPAYERLVSKYKE